MKAKVLHCADLFAGAGGMSTGLFQAARHLGVKVKLLAVNHWAVAIATHTKNHPEQDHFCDRVDAVDPRKAVPGGRLHLMCAGIECTHHSNARGAKPMSDQSRSSAWDVLKWAEQLYIDNIIIENVQEFRDWGPLGANGRPLQSKKGQLYQQFLRSLRALGYTVNDRVLNCAHYGDATTRRRLFIQASRGKHALTWPEQTHVENPDSSLFPAQKWRTARQIIDWSLPSQSIYKRKKPLAAKTMDKIFEGLRKFSGMSFVIGQQSGSSPRNVDEPIPTIAAAGAISLVEPFIVILRNNQDVHGVDEPLRTMTTSGANFGLCQPFVIPITHSACNHFRGHAIDGPLPTITASSGGELGLVEPFLVPFYGSREGQPARCVSIDDPLDTVSTANRFGLAQPYLVKFNGTGGAQSVDDPLDTVTTKDRFGLVEPGLEAGAQMAILDIKFRMLQPHELAGAMSFPVGYQFEGTKKDKVRQIGNAVPVRTAEALCLSAFQRLAMCA